MHLDDKHNNPFVYKTASKAFLFKNVHFKEEFTYCNQIYCNEYFF